MFTSSLGFLIFCSPLLIAGQSEPALADFGDVIPVFGQMARTDQDFKDGLALDLFSPKNRTLVVTQNTSPLPGNFVQRSTGEGFVSLSKYSWIIKFNESAHDLMAKIELPFDPKALAEQGIQPANTYVGKLAEDKKTWVVTEAKRNVHMTENKTRMIKMNSMDGEYMLLGRKSEDFANIFVQYGQGATRTVNVTGNAAGIQEAEFIDGLRLKIQSSTDFGINADIPFGVDAKAIPDAHSMLNSFVWKINSTAATGNVSVEMSFPVNRGMLREQGGGRGGERGERGGERGGEQKHEGIHLVLGRRDKDAAATTCFELVQGQHFSRRRHAIKVKDMTSVDGQYAILVAPKKDAPFQCGGAGENGNQTAPAKEVSGGPVALPVASNAVTHSEAGIASKLMLLGLLAGCMSAVL